MVVALREAGDDGSAHRAGAGEDDREASAVDGVVREGEAVAGFDGFAVALEDAANRIRAAGEAADGVALAANPVSLARRGAGCGSGKELLAGDLDFDGSSRVGRKQSRAHEVAELPGCEGVERGEAEKFFLLINNG